MPLSSKNSGSGLWCTVSHEDFLNGIFSQDIQDETKYSWWKCQSTVIDVVNMKLSTILDAIC